MDGEIELAVEVVSPRSRDGDRIDKPARYARLGIGEFWRADRDEAGVVHVAVFRLDADRRVYVPTGTVPLDELEQR
ncbi:MAG TPA: Uma2 family endonuclease [Actinocatenispora sp.]